jgi:hypothetical protein
MKASALGVHSKDEDPCAGSSLVGGGEGPMRVRRGLQRLGLGDADALRDGGRREQTSEAGMDAEKPRDTVHRNGAVEHKQIPEQCGIVVCGGSNDAGFGGGEDLTRDVSPGLTGQVRDGASRAIWLSSGHRAHRQNPQGLQRACWWILSAGLQEPPSFQGDRKKARHRCFMARKCHRQGGGTHFIFLGEQFWGRAARASWTRKSLGRSYFVSWFSSESVPDFAASATSHFILSAARRSPLSRLRVRTLGCPAGPGVDRRWRGRFGLRKQHSRREAERFPAAAVSPT